MWRARSPDRGREDVFAHTIILSLTRSIVPKYFLLLGSTYLPLMKSL
ncbi:MAG TPA: hypothetical protein PLB89_00450 [Flavobacteriales bacterium]|nr:hypothetical protein [Flavobacteriales bacterium]